MPYKTRYGSHYHETYGCCGATDPCSASGLAPCSICCGGGGDGSSDDNNPPGGGGGAVGFDDAGSFSLEAEMRPATVGGVPSDAAPGGEPGLPGVGDEPASRAKALSDGGTGAVGGRQAEVPDSLPGDAAGRIPSEQDRKAAQEAAAGNRSAPACEIVVVSWKKDASGGHEGVAVAVSGQGHYQLPTNMSDSEYGQIASSCAEHYLQSMGDKVHEDTRLITFYNPDTHVLSFGAISVGFAYRQTMENEGMSLQLTDASVPTDGYMVACDPGDNADIRKATVKPASEFASQEEYEEEFKSQMADFVRRNADVLTRDGMHLGTWLDPETGICYFDISERVEDVEEAKRLGAQRNEISVWDVKNMTEIDTGGDGTW